jgi:hypothetical protein
MTRRTAALIASGSVLVVALAGAWFVARPGTFVPSTVHDAVTIECTGATGVTADVCGEWADAILVEDRAPRTFEREDLRRLRLDRSLHGFGGECRAEWYLLRYPDSPVWSDEVACR